MRVVSIKINNFRGVKYSSLLLPHHGVLIGDNNVGKTTVLEALDLVLGPDRLHRQPVIDEHDFFRGQYTLKPQREITADSPAEKTDGNRTEAVSNIETDEQVPQIEIEVIIAALNGEQKNKFGDYIEFWDSKTNQLYDKADPKGVDTPTISEVLRVTFIGSYDKDEDDFDGKTYFTRSLLEDDNPALFNKRHKQLCGFLYLRSLRTGSRALSLERGSLLDIILRLNEVRPQMWEATLNTLANLPVGSDPELGISPILESINAALKKYVPKEWGVEPHLRVSNLTREHLRKTITAFIATGDGDHAAPFYRQGTGTINMLVLAMLSQIAENKQNVIFAMEEPETAIPPYAQKRIVHEVRKLASQAIFTSHSPYVLEEFTIKETVVLSRDSEGLLTQQSIVLPENVKPKRYRQDFRIRFCEGLLARRVLIVEGATEASAFPAACRLLAELEPDTYSSLEALGVCVVDAGGETDIPGVAQLFKKLGKQTFALCDKQGETNKKLIEEHVEQLFMHDEKGFENMVLKGATEESLKAFCKQLCWPQHLTQRFPDPENNVCCALQEYFIWAKGCWGIADFLSQRSLDEIPEWIRNTAIELKNACAPASACHCVDPEPELTPKADGNEPH
ncbi:ATP-dependent nuclease [Desulfobulbus oligotrophicus]|uniref:AAA family ATPase n=1 Tax=Desulfobulbus oligotrophicus TaxID=1909699 RepID=A0A7T5VFK5_9BACT|nr:AAA family ATPase [Desulfobulbus oligotrophicus]